MTGVLSPRHRGNSTAGGDIIPNILALYNTRGDDLPRLSDADNRGLTDDAIAFEVLLSCEYGHARTEYYADRNDRRSI